jgi:hypothetical protein
MERELLETQPVHSMMYTYNININTCICIETPIQGFFEKQWILTLNWGKSQMEETVYPWSMKLNIK